MGTSSSNLGFNNSLFLVINEQQDQCQPFRVVNLEKQLLCHHFAFLNPASMCGTWWCSPIDNAEQLAVMRDYVLDAKDSIKSLAEQCKSSVAVSSKFSTSQRNQTQ